MQNSLWPDCCFYVGASTSEWATAHCRWIIKKPRAVNHCILMVHMLYMTTGPHLSDRTQLTSGWHHQVRHWCLWAQPCQNKGCHLQVQVRESCTSAWASKKFWSSRGWKFRIQYLDFDQRFQVWIGHLKMWQSRLWLPSTKQNWSCNQGRVGTTILLNAQPRGPGPELQAKVCSTAWLSLSCTSLQGANILNIL